LLGSIPGSRGYQISSSSVLEHVTELIMQSIEQIALNKQKKQKNDQNSDNSG
jgi:hypothetical protein